VPTPAAEARRWADAELQDPLEIMDQKEWEFRWFNEESIPGVLFGLNDSVLLIRAGEPARAGRRRQFL
jgi:hypothetical protein